MYAPLTTVASVKAWSDNTGTANDGQIQTIIGRASELVGKYCGRANLGEVLTFNETRFTRGKRLFQQRIWDLVLRQYPIVSITSILINNNVIQTITPTQLMAGQSGVFIDDALEPRLLKFVGIDVVDPGIVNVIYTAGYNGIGNIPGGLQQAVDQYVVEIMRSAKFVNLKSESMAGETTSYDMGGDWGMSNRVSSMLQPYKDVAGWAL